MHMHHHSCIHCCNLVAIMMNRMMANIQRVGRLRKPQSTIISQETIKPSSSTPPHLKTHNLSLIDYLNPNIHMPIVFFYQNYNNRDKNILKKSLSQTLTQYYPFAGRLPAPSSPHIECNDKGVEFVEASIDTQINDFILEKEPDESLDQLTPNALGCAVNKTSSNMVAVQLSHFTCGGAALAVSISHKLADGLTIVNFVNHWATVTRGGTPSIKNPNFFTSSLGKFKILDFPDTEITGASYTIRRFVFSNSKINELKSKINTMGGGDTSPINPTRSESLTALLFKCAATTKPGSSSLNRMVSLRGRTAANFPKLAQGNLFVVTTTNMKDSSQVELHDVIRSMRKEIVELQGVRGVDEIGNIMVKASQTLMNDETRTYTVSSLCRFPFYEADFGWGKPDRVMIGTGSVDANLIFLMDTPCGTGIEAIVKLEEDEMAIFLKNKELLEYAQQV